MTKNTTEAPLADDLLIGAEEIAAFMYGDREKKRRIFHFVGNGELPIFRVGDMLHARKSTLRAFIAGREAEALAAVKQASAA